MTDGPVRAARARALRLRAPGLLVALLLAAFLTLAAASGPRSHALIYWANLGGETIGRANLNGTGVKQSFIRGAHGLNGVAVDGAHIYWTNFEGTTIGRANLNGTGVNQSFISGAGEPAGIAVTASK